MATPECRDLVDSGPSAFGRPTAKSRQPFGQRLSVLNGNAVMRRLRSI